MYKSTISIISICLLSACGSGSSDEPVNPFSPVADSQAPEQIQSDPITAPVEQTIVEPIVQPVQQPIVQPAPVRGPCVDTAPVNDGFGWDGVGTCLTPIVATVEPEPVTDPVIEPVVSPPVQAPVLSPAPEIFHPGTNELISLVTPGLTFDDIADRRMVCDVVFWDSNLRQLIKGSNGTTTWEHFADGTGEMLAFRGVPVSFEWSIDEQGLYQSEQSPFSQEFAERVQFPNSRVAYRFWSSENVLQEFYECHWE